MPRIRDIVQINSGYTSYVDLYEDYYDLVKNRGRMERYKPIAAHRQVFEKIANALNPRDRRFYFLSGSYGTGKSHLLLMLANYFASPSDVPEIETFFKNYEDAQRDVLLKPGETLKESRAVSLKEARKSGRFLVALCRYGLNLDFEGTLLRALEEALEKEDSNILLDSHYLEALRRIEDWESRRNETRFFNDLEMVIRTMYPDWTLNDLVGGLEDYDEHALKAFKACFQKVTDAEFTYKKDNLRDIISDFLANPEFKKEYKGIVFLYDEFGAAIDSGLVDYTTLLDFAQYCANSTLEKGGTVIFVGAGHKGFRNHGKVGDLNAETLVARVSEIGLQTQGMEDIIAAIVQPMKDSSEWREQVQQYGHKFTSFTVDCNRLNLFNWLPAPKIKNNIIQNIYPMHPLATFSLLRLAGEAGSDNRSVFTFFSPEFETGEEGWKNVQAYSYPWFLENQEIQENKKLILYTSDLLVDYFKESLKATNTKLEDSVKTAIINYEATLRELNAYMARKSEGKLFDELDELMLRIIKVMLVNEIASTQNVVISNTKQNIAFALDYVSPDEEKQVENRLKLLCDAGILYNSNGVYELMRGDRKDIHRLVEHFKANPDNRPVKLLDSFSEHDPLSRDEQFLEAKDYNSTYYEDKRLKVVFATPAMLSEERVIAGETVSFFTGLEYDRLQIMNASSGYEGTAVYVFCENDGDIDAAKKAVARNDQPRVVVAIPRNPIQVYDHIFTLNALKSEWFRKQSEDFSPFERADEKNIRDEAINHLKEAKKAYFSNAKVFWFGEKGKEIPVQDNKPYDAANRLIQEHYGSKRNTIPHNEFNKTHINLSGQVRKIFEEAGDTLCDLSQQIRVNWTWPDNRGDTKYIRKCFVDHQALKISNIQGDYRFLDPEKDLNKFRAKMPAYARLLEELTALESQGETNVVQFLRPFFEEYGQGEIAVTLMLLLARRFYGDSIRFKREPNTLTDIRFSSTSDMLALVQGTSPSAVVIFEPVSEEEQEYFGKITQIFTNQPAPAGKVYSLNEAYQAAVNWWDGLPIVARALDLYSEEERPLAEAFSQAKTKDPFRFIKYNLMELVGLSQGEVLNRNNLNHIEIYLKAFKSHAEAIQAGIEGQILEEVAKIFGADSKLDVDIQEAFKNWYTGLSSSQSDPLGHYHNNDSKPLVKITSYVNIREMLFEKLPEAYSLGKVSTWMNNYVANYMQRIRQGKEHIEKNAPKISVLEVKFENELSQRGDQVIYKEELILHAGTDDGQGVIFYTDDGSDPATSRQRQKLTPGDTLTIKGNRRVKLVVADMEGRYGSVKTIEAIDELEKYKIVRPAQKTAFDETITFVFPRSKEATKITLSSLIIEILSTGIVSSDELKRMFLEIIMR